MTEPVEFLYSEERISEVLGLARDHISSVRKRELTLMADYALMSNHLAYTEAGVLELLGHLKIELPKKKAMPGGISLSSLLKRSQVPSRTASEAAHALLDQPDPEAATWQPHDQLLECVRPAAKNRTLVLCRFFDTPMKPTQAQFYAEVIAGESVVHVRVRTNENFVAGMELPCRHISGYAWELTRRLPRSRGHW